MRPAHSYRSLQGQSLGVVERTFSQVHTFWEKLHSISPVILVPSFPEAPNAKSLTDPVYVEKKRRQFQRFFDKILGRPVVLASAVLQQFIQQNAAVSNVVGQS